MTNEDLETLVENVSIPRISEYVNLGFQMGSEELIEAYFNMQEMSSHFFVPIQMLEICLRNTLCNVLSRRFDEKAIQVGKNKWYELIPISEISKGNIITAKDKASKKTNYSDDDVVANLMFGFWIYLLEPIHNNNRNNPYHFWQYEIDNVFPGRNGKKVNEIFENLKQINKKRNRLYHHEPIWKKKATNDFNKAVGSLKRDYKLINEAIGWVSPEKKMYMERLGFKERFLECCEKHRK